MKTVNANQPTGKEEAKSTQQLHDEVWTLLEEKGLTLSERMKVRSYFASWGRSFNPNIEINHKHKSITNKKLKGYAFETQEEAEFIGAMVDFAPNVKEEKLIQVFSIVLKLFDIKSGWSFRSGNTEKETK
jgi:hypothetical protein